MSNDTSCGEDFEKDRWANARPFSPTFVVFPILPFGSS